MRTKLLLILILLTVLTQLCTVSVFAVTNGEKNKGSILQEQCTAWNAPPEGRGNRQSRGAPRNNQAQNEQTRKAAREVGLSREGQEKLHDDVHGMNYDYQQVLEAARDIARLGGKYLR